MPGFVLVRMVRSALGGLDLWTGLVAVGPVEAAWLGIVGSYKINTIRLRVFGLEIEKNEMTSLVWARRLIHLKVVASASAAQQQSILKTQLNFNNVG